MQDPVYEVVTVFRGLLQSPNATVQRDTLQAFYAPDASFDHPFYTVVSGQNVGVTKAVCSGARRRH